MVFGDHQLIQLNEGTVRDIFLSILCNCMFASKFIKCHTYYNSLHRCISSVSLCTLKLRVQNLSFEELKKQMYDMFTMTLERIQLLYVNPGKFS